MRRGFVLILCVLMAGCAAPNSRVATKLNADAAPNGGLPYNPLGWKVITSAVNRQNSTMYTVFGNDVAVGYARSHSQHDYPVGSVVSLVTWVQQEDPRWFGGYIPAAPSTVEFVTVGAGSDGQASYRYEEYEGKPLRKVVGQYSGAPGERASYVLGHRAAVMP